jgi:hypothetical protein
MIRTVILASLLCSASVSQADDSRLVQSLIVEWMVAHCALEEIPAATVAVARMVIDASDAERVESERSWLRDGIAANYSTNKDACADLNRG